MPGNTEVQFQTSFGNITIQLFNDVPITTANFLYYVTHDSYDNSFFHRLVQGFVLQGGGYATSGTNVVTVPAVAPITNEYSANHPNALGTIAMARTSDPNSATSQFFFNLVDNSAQLPGYAVFGQVIDGLNVLMTLGGLTVVNAGSPFNELPVTNYTGGGVGFNNLVYYHTEVLGVANNDTGSALESGLASGSLVTNDVDLDTPVLAIATVNGQAANVGQTITLASGARVTVNANGTYSYDPNHAFDNLSGVEGASNHVATDRFTYALVGGGINSGSATVTITITGVDSPGEVALGTFGSEVLTGHGNADTIFGLGGLDILNGAGGDDRLIGGLGADEINGGEGSDTASYEDDFGPVFVNLTTGFGYGGAAQGDTYSSIENIVGTSFDDFIIGDNNANRLEGLGGNDIFIGSLGADVFDGGSGSDTVSYIDNQGPIFINLTSGLGYNNAAQGDSFISIENITGGIYNDFIIGNAVGNVIDGGAGDDYIIGALGPDTIIGGSGIDTASYEDNQGPIFINLTTGHGYGNAAEGDTFSGIENVVGELYDDFIIGDANANRIEGRYGNDTLIGADGADTFVFNTALSGSGNVDTITDFAHGSDHIELSRSIFTALGLGTLTDANFALGAATTVDQHILYDAATGNLSYDADGSAAGAAIVFANLSSHPATITSADFVITP